MPEIPRALVRSGIANRPRPVPIIPSPAATRTAPRRLLGRLVAGVAAGALLATGLALPARAETAVSLDDGSVTVSGKGYGHGWGMSQWGAYGAATKGLSAKQILAFYYPGTTLSVTKTSHLRVHITDDTDGDLRVLPSAGLRVYNVGTSTSYTLPSGSRYKQWRMTRSGSAYRLQYRNAAGTWITHTPGRLNASKAWRFDNPADLLKVVLPSGSVRELRGQSGLVFVGSTTRTVNRLPLERYVQAVVPAEMPTSWHPEAVKAQAVAARTYALRIKAGAESSQGFDVCDTVACQVYRGVAQTSPSGTRTAYETSRGTSATVATAGLAVHYRGALALTQFSASNGGASAKGDYPYLVAQADPYDTVKAPQTWQVRVSRSSLTRAFSGLGTVTKVQVLKRDGSGPYGGRITSIRISGTTATRTVDGANFRRALGLRSQLAQVVD